MFSKPEESILNLRIFCRIGAPAIRLAGLGGLLGFAGCATRPEPSHAGIPWPATDAVGRSLPVAVDGTGVLPHRAVGIFYFITHSNPGAAAPKDLSVMLGQDPNLLQEPDSPLWGPKGTGYYWGKPLYGYYDSQDPWVLRRHAALLSDAGIDTIIFDTTNRRTYKDVYLKLCQVWTAVRREGGRTPQICFMVNTKAGATAEELYRDLYRPGRYKALWFRWQGKPLLICDPREASPQVAAFFTLRKAHWPFTLANTHNEWHWESIAPQVYSYDEDPRHPEEVSVAVAQNLRDSDGRVTNMSLGNARGRSFHDGEKDASAHAIDRGFNFAEQWRRAIDLAPPFVLVTGWNEWTAGKFTRPDHPVVFVDQFDEEYSRDIEPVTGMHQDNYYYQLVDGVRRYKGVPAMPRGSPPKSILLTKGFGQWREVGPQYDDPAFDNLPRDFGRGARHYADSSGRNDLVAMKVARDAENVYFYARTRQRLTPRTDPNWMLLLLDVDCNRSTGWEGYDYIVNRSIDADGTWLERSAGGSAWEKVAKVQIKVSGNELMLAVPRSALGLAPGARVKLDFKWWDNPQRPGEITDAYISGDAAPDGRFNYRYEADQPQ
jgi:hypothetical protein